MRPCRFLVACALLLLSACRESSVSRDWTTMDCNFAATVHGTGKIPASAALDSIEASSRRYERLFTDYDRQSPLSRLRGRKGDTLRLDPEIMTVLRKAQEMQRRSSDAFDLGMHDLKALWGIGTPTSHVPARDSIERLLKRRFGFVPGPTDSLPFPLRILSDTQVVLLTDSLPIDLGGIAKGYIVDRLSDQLTRLGFGSHLLQGGGEIRARGRKSAGPWKIGVKNPRQTDSVLAIVSLEEGQAISTSGDYERFFLKDGKRYHHIFSPRTGMPADGATISVSVLCSTSLDCDAITKPLFVLGPRHGRPLADSLGLSALWIRESASGLCGRSTDAWGSRLDRGTLPECQGDW